MGLNDLEHIESMTQDFEHNYLEVQVVDGRAFRVESSTPRPAPLDFKRVTFHPADLLMRLVTATGEKLEVEVFGNDDEVARRRGRPVVYLDQNIWVQISKALRRPEEVPKSELDTTLELIERARRAEMILPISSGHWIETSPTFGERRRRLAALLVGLSRGWIMRHPLRVAASEMTALFRSLPAGGSPQVESAFTLDHQHLLAEPALAYVPRDPELPQESIQLIEALAGLSSTLAVLLEDEGMERQGVAAATNWAAAHQELGTLIAANRGGSFDPRKFTFAAFLVDLGDELIDAARISRLTPSDLQAWGESRAENDLAQLPSLGRRRELIHLRLMNTGDLWKVNDLVDVLYLSCAAGYADYVVCEKKMGDYLQRVARQLPGGATVVTSVSELVAALERAVADRSR